MNLAIITGSMGQGGLEKHTSFISNYFSKKGWSVKIITLFQSNKNCEWRLEEGVSIEPIPSKYDTVEHRIKAIPGWLNFIKKTLNSYKPCRILCMTPRIGALTALACPKFQKRIVVMEINDPHSPRRNILENKFIEFFLLKNIKGYIFQTEWEKSCYGKKAQTKSRVIQNPCQVNIEPSFTYDNRIVCTSRLDNEQKRYDIALTIFEKLAKKFPDITLEIYGGGCDEKTIKQFASKLDSRDRIRFHGPTKDVMNEIKGARCFLMTSDFEGLSNSLLEANLIGIPCVSSDWPGINSVIKDNVNGFIYKRQDVDQAIEKITNILTNDKLCLRFSKSGVALRKKFEPSNTLPKYFQFITE